MPLWKSLNQANAAPKFLGVLAKDKAYAQTAAITTTGTFTLNSANITAMATTTGINLNQSITSSTVGANLNTGATVTAIINSTAVTMSSVYQKATAVGATISFQNGGVRGENLYNNSTPNAFQNGQSVGVFNVLNIPNYVTITANTIAGNNWLTNPVGTFSNVQTGAVTQGSALITGMTSTANISIGMAIYSTAANTTGGSPVWANNLAVANVINTTAVLMNTTSTLTNAAAAFYFSKIAPGTVASGNGLPGLTVGTTGSTTTSVTTITGTISNGTIGSNGNILNVTAFSGPPLAVGQEILANSTLAIANGTYVVSTTSRNGIGSYVLNANSISNGAVGAAVTMSTIVPAVVSVNSTVIVLSSNAYAISNNTGNTVNFSTYEKSVFGRGVSAGWVEVKYGTGPVSTFTVNSTSTAGYSNGETVIISGGSANGLGIITTNTVAGTAGANIASVAVSYGGYGFTNTAGLTYTYQHQLHVANVTATGTPTSYVAGDKVTVSCSFALASFTGVVRANVLTASSVTGTISIGNLITGTGVAANTKVLSQLSGTAGGAGTYAVSGNENVASASMTSTGQIIAAVANITSTSVSNSTITVTTPGLFTSGLTAANLVFTYSNSTGGTGTGSGITFAGSFASVSSGASVNATLGGKAGRIYSETLVPLMTTTQDNADDNNAFPNS